MGTHPPPGGSPSGQTHGHTPNSNRGSQVPGPDQPRKLGTGASDCLSVGRWAEDGVLVPLEHGSGTSSLIFMAAQEQCHAPNRPPRNGGNRNVGAAKAKKSFSSSDQSCGCVLCKWVKVETRFSSFLLCQCLCGYISTALCVCAWVDYFLFRCPSKLPPRQNPNLTFEKGLLKAKTHFYVCSPARRLAVLGLFPIFFLYRKQDAKPFFCAQPHPTIYQKEERGGGVSAGQGQSSQPHRCLGWVLEKLQFSLRKKAKTTSWSRFDMAGDQIPPLHPLP